MIDQMAGEKERGEGFFSYTQEYRHLIKKKKKSEKKRPIASEKKEFLKDRKKDEADKSKSQYSPNITRIPGRFVPQEIDSENLPFPSGSPEEGEKTRDGKIGREHHSIGVSSGDNDPFFFIGTTAWEDGGKMVAQFITLVYRLISIVVNPRYERALRIDRRKGGGRGVQLVKN